VSEGESQSGSEDKDEFEDDVMALQNFSFISVETNSTNFEMYALVQLAMRNWVNCSSSLERWKQQSVSNFSGAYPTGEYRN
jgi:hypothetical protein